MRGCEGENCRKWGRQVGDWVWRGTGRGEVEGLGGCKGGKRESDGGTGLVDLYGTGRMCRHTRTATHTPAFLYLRKC